MINVKRKLSADRPTFNTSQKNLAMTNCVGYIAQAVIKLIQVNWIKLHNKLVRFDRECTCRSSGARAHICVYPPHAISFLYFVPLLCRVFHKFSVFLVYSCIQFSSLLVTASSLATIPRVAFGSIIELIALMLCVCTQLCSTPAKI